MTTHYMEEARLRSNSHYDNGRIIASGTPEELKKTGGDSFISDSDNLKARLEIENCSTSRSREEQRIVPHDTRAIRAYLKSSRQWARRSSREAAEADTE